MKSIIILLFLFCFVNAYSAEICPVECPHETTFCANGWIIHDENDFEQILEQKLSEFIPEVGEDLVLDDAESYKSDYSHDYYLIMWVIIWDRVSTEKDEMWGDVAFSRTCPYTGEYTEIRWYDPVTKKKHIVFNPAHTCCLTTKPPLAYNTIF